MSRSDQGGAATGKRLAAFGLILGSGEMQQRCRIKQQKEAAMWPLGVRAGSVARGSSDVTKGTRSVWSHRQPCGTFFDGRVGVSGRHRVSPRCVH